MVAHRFSEQIACFFAKNERVSDLLKKRAIRAFAHFWWSTWAIRSHWSFWWTTWSICSHCSLKKREWANRPFKKKNIYKTYQKYNFIQIFLWIAHLLIYHERPDRISHGRSFFMSDLSDLLKVALLIWTTWAICSQLLICPERSERIAHSRSFDLSDLSEWAISEWANSQPWVFSTRSANLQIALWGGSGPRFEVETKVLQYNPKDANCNCRTTTFPSTTTPPHMPKDILVSELCRDGCSNIYRCYWWFRISGYFYSSLCVQNFPHLNLYPHVGVSLSCWHPCILMGFCSIM